MKVGLVPLERGPCAPLPPHKATGTVGGRSLAKPAGMRGP